MRRRLRESPTLNVTSGLVGVCNLKGSACTEKEAANSTSGASVYTYNKRSGKWWYWSLKGLLENRLFLAHLGDWVLPSASVFVRKYGTCAVTAGMSDVELHVCSSRSQWPHKYLKESFPYWPSELVLFNFCPKYVVRSSRQHNQNWLRI
jgi:hypothetical protein